MKYNQGKKVTKAFMPLSSQLCGEEKIGEVRWHFFCLASLFRVPNDRNNLSLRYFTFRYLSRRFVCSKHSIKDKENAQVYYHIYLKLLNIIIFWTLNFSCYKLFFIFRTYFFLPINRALGLRACDGIITHVEYFCYLTSLVHFRTRDSY